ncbi:MAG: DASS family sodium-coupled anion symporter [Bacteroidota bacterium]
MASDFNQKIFRWIKIILGPLVCLCLNLIDVQLISQEADQVISVAAWMVIWWITEPVSISVTALLPIVLFPFLGIMPLKEVTANYGSSIIFLFFGGFILALAMEKVNLHKRIALQIILLTGTGEKGVLLGFILATSLLSMWISNTATTLVILPIALSIVSFLKERNNKELDSQYFDNFKIACMLGIAYSANIGGTATIIGTPPNMVLIGYMEDQMQRQMDFLQWMSIALPFALIMLAATYLLLVRMFSLGRGSNYSPKSVIREEIRQLGKISGDEISVLVVFGVTIFLWVFRIQIVNFTGFQISNTQIAMMGAMGMLIIPSIKGNQSILNWNDTKRMQWGILILFGGGLALAKAFEGAGIIELIGSYVEEEGFQATSAIPFITTVMLFMTELMSNVALVNIFAPIVAGVADGIGVDFLEVGIPVALASSCAFMLPISTPPNAIVYSSGYVKVIQMIKAGVLLNILAVLLLVVLGLFWVSFMQA